jgi:hypothetical protein
MTEQLSEEEFKGEYRKASDPMHKKVEDAVKANGEEFQVYYSAYKSTEEGIPIDNLDAIPMQGKIIIVDEGSTFYGSGEAYRSKTLDSPTWLELCVVANEMILSTKDLHHVYLEGVMATKQVLTLQDMTEIKVCNLIMGS